MINTWTIEVVTWIDNQSGRINNSHTHIFYTHTHLDTHWARRLRCTRHTRHRTHTLHTTLHSTLYHDTGHTQHTQFDISTHTTLHSRTWHTHGLWQWSHDTGHHMWHRTHMIHTHTTNLTGSLFDFPRSCVSVLDQLGHKQALITKSIQLHDSIEGLSQKIVSITLHYITS